MKAFVAVIYIIDFILIIISIINIIRANKHLNTRNQDLKELIKAKEINQKLSFDVLVYENIFNAICEIVFGKSKESAEDKITKIKEVIQSTKQNNF